MLQDGHPYWPSTPPLRQAPSLYGGIVPAQESTPDQEAPLPYPPTEIESDADS